MNAGLAVVPIVAIVETIVLVLSHQFQLNHIAILRSDAQLNLKLDNPEAIVKVALRFVRDQYIHMALAQADV